ncbi:hypothetical protein N7532_008911 [Penicillium argentinense]|uniref:Rhodopsin domain-containing protein n=1 Tax=Penicillium argentinense TaxID=1131581 RepID=A0A9W9K2Z3_9EURO|nr:uncharacterized protein N7532_008911 [Penicillium argentinense]KAJ5090227.1 hypothetical protein N7532_008911 [Penicillium argentinense]
MLNPHNPPSKDAPAQCAPRMFVHVRPIGYLPPFTSGYSGDPRAERRLTAASCKNGSGPRKTIVGWHAMIAAVYTWRFRLRLLRACTPAHGPVFSTPTLLFITQSTLGCSHSPPSWCTASALDRDYNSVMGPYVPPGQSPPFEVIDDFHHGAYIIITAALGLVVSLVCFLIRLYVRLMLIPPFARDDFVLLGATIVACLQSVLMFYACSRGFGTSINLLDEGRLITIQALIATSDIFALLIIYLSKCCVLAIYLRLTPQKTHNRATWATLAICTAWFIPAVFILLVNCELNKPWRIQGAQCRNLYQRWQFIASVDVITELIIFLLAVTLLKGLFMNLKRKLSIGFAFIFRFPLIVFTLLHISKLRSALNNPDVTLSAIEPTLWLQVEVHYALVACSVFCLRPFMAAVSTNYGTAGDSTLESSASRSRGTKGSSKSGSNSGSGSSSNPTSRSRSLSRVQRKRAGTAGTNSWPKLTPAPRSPSTEKLCCQDTPHGTTDGGKRKPSPGRPASREPIRRSMFPLGAPSIPPAPAPRLKGKEGGKKKPGPSLLDADPNAIEMMPPLQRQSARPQSEHFDADPERMVIRKEVGYSIQYEYDEARRRGLAPSKKNSNDAMAYV